MSTQAPTALLQVPVVKLAHAPEDLPAYATPGSAAMDLRAAIETPITLGSLERALIPTGLIVMIPEGHEAQIRPRSGLAIRHGLSLINAVGTIDSDYRDELKVPLVNLSNEAYTLQPGDRIAQLLIAQLVPFGWQQVETVSAPTSEGRAGGFGSTGR